jgi:predicted  nucleic acid-binding Zn-ribbon protein
MQRPTTDYERLKARFGEMEDANERLTVRLGQLEESNSRLKTALTELQDRFTEIQAEKDSFSEAVRRLEDDVKALMQDDDWDITAQEPAREGAQRID